jgi:hypothetical protein
MPGHDASLWGWWWKDPHGGTERRICVDPREMEDQWRVVDPLLTRVRSWFERAIADNAWPQLIVASQADAQFVAELSRWLMDMPYLPATELGRYLAWFVERSAMQGQSALIVLDDVYGREWIRSEDGDWGTWLQPPLPDTPDMGLDVSYDPQIETLLANAEQLRTLGGARWAQRQTQVEQALLPWCSGRGEYVHDWWAQYCGLSLEPRPAHAWWVQDEYQRALYWRDRIAGDRERIQQQPLWTDRRGNERANTFGIPPARRQGGGQLASVMVQQEIYADLDDNLTMWYDALGRAAAVARGKALLGIVTENEFVTWQQTLSVRADDSFVGWAEDPYAGSTPGAERMTPTLLVQELRVQADGSTHMTVQVEHAEEGALMWWLPAPVATSDASSSLQSARSNYTKRVEPTIYTEPAAPLPPLVEEDRLTMLEGLRRR